MISGRLALIILFGLPRVWAGGDGGWETFTDNLATDLAPLIALFGERLTKQFLSESTSRLDNFIFALAPLGILTAVVSVIRVCGNSSLRAFVGRAQEAPGEAEHELLSCVSETTAELFNDSGISRVFGRPRILEVVVWEEVDPLGKQSSYKIGTLREALQQDAWHAGSGGWILDEKGSLPELDIPNLSLNKGIKPRGRGWFYSAALLGTVLQIGTVVYAALTVFNYPERFKKDEKLVESYAFPLYLYGSISLTIGMFLCAFIIERSTIECYLYPSKPSKIYWLQPGRQTIGDQDFGAFLGVNEGPDSQMTKELTYIKSIRGLSPRGKGFLLIFTIFVTMIGFVVQFVGLRGLHPSVVLAELGSTLLMAIVRTCLRTKRIGPEANHFPQEEKDLTSYSQQELDCFAFHLENVESFRLISSPAIESNRSRAGSVCTANSSQSSQSLAQNFGLGTKLVQTRARLAELTSNAGQHASMNWDDLPIRKIARDLASAIEMTMDVVSRWKNMSSNICSFELSFACQPLSHKTMGSPVEAYPIMINRSDDTLLWKINAYELEAVLGLWTFSLLKLDSNWRQKGLGRLVGLAKSEDKTKEADLYFHKWIYRQREARMVSSKMIPFSEQLFGYYSDEYPDDKEVLVVKTDNKLEIMAAQDIYIQFLMSILEGLEELGGDLDVLAKSEKSFFAQSTRIDELVNCFESGNLGSKEDGLLCIVPVLKHRGLLPKITADSANIRVRVENLISTGDWQGGFSIIQWLCERGEDKEFERSLYELGFLCQRAMLHQDNDVRQRGCKQVCLLLQSDIRAEFFRNLRSPRPANWMNSHIQREWWIKFSKQLGWVSWHISNDRSERHSMKAALESSGASQHLILQVNGQEIDEAEAEFAQPILLGWLTNRIVLEFYRDVPGPEDLKCLELVNKCDQTALRHWLLVKWAHMSKTHDELRFKSLVFSAQIHSDLAIQTLCRHGVDINFLGPKGRTALIETITLEDVGAVKTLLANGADVRIGTIQNNFSPLSVAASAGNEEISKLLLEHGADLEDTDHTGNTALLMAVNENRLNTTRLLLEKGASTDAVGYAGIMPLTQAVMNRNRQIVEMLIDHGVNINAKDPFGCTPLILAIKEAARDVVFLFLERGVAIEQKDSDGMVALDWARELQNQEIMVALESISGR